MSKMYYKLHPKSRIVHTNGKCRYMVDVIPFTGPTAKKPAHHTVCDNCQRLDKLERKRPM